MPRGLASKNNKTSEEVVLTVCSEEGPVLTPDGARRVLAYMDAACKRSERTRQLAYRACEPIYEPLRRRE